MSKPLKADEAHVLGLVDAIAPQEELVMTARQWALEILEQRRPWIPSIYRNDRLEPLGKAREILKFARAQAQKQAPNLQHLLLCIDAIEKGVVSGSRAGLLKEAEDFQKVLHSHTCKCLVNVFIAQCATSKVPRITDIGLVPRRVNKIAVLGGGLMGSGIATVLILNKYYVILKEVNEKFLEAGINRIKANLQSHVQKGKMPEENFETALTLLKGVLDYENFRDVDLVIEAVIENVPLKQQVFADLETYCPPHCILASNTSTIDINLIGETTKSHDRIVGAHFFSPAHVMPLLEVVRTQKTSPQVIVDLLELGRRFIDCAISKFGMPMGPFRTIDLIGFGVFAAVGVQFLKSFPERCYKSALMQVLLEDKRAGEATRKGFYLYDIRRKASPDPEMTKYIEKSRSIAGVTPDPQLMKLADKDIVEMLFFPVVNESCRILDEGIALKASDLDIASVMGRGFPRYRGGIMFWADNLGSKYICSKMETWAKKYGDFYKPCAYLAERAAKGASLRAPVEQANSRL
ncbi:hypothetical protein MRB53_032151 [Persea americana]|nr:hypothetical protein MRB53_032151 [Persea americana]